MKKLNSTLFFGLVLLLIVAGCNSFKKTNPGDIKEVGEQQNDKVNIDDATLKYNTLVNNIAQNSLWNMRLSEVGDKISTDPKIKQLTTLVANDHQAIYSRMQGIAQEKAISISGDITDQNKQQLLNLQNMQGVKFDSSYCALVIESSNTTISQMNSLANLTNDTAIKEWSSNMLIMLNDHLNTASDNINIYRKPL